MAIGRVVLSQQTPDRDTSIVLASADYSELPFKQIDKLQPELDDLFKNSSVSVKRAPLC
jgi:hypothetical protein